MHDIPSSISFHDLPSRVRIAQIKEAKSGGLIFFFIIGVLITLIGFVTLIFGPEHIYYNLSEGMNFLQFIQAYPGPITSIGAAIIGITNQMLGATTTRYHEQLNKAISDAVLIKDEDVPDGFQLNMMQDEHEKEVFFISLVEKVDDMNVIYPEDFINSLLNREVFSNTVTVSGDVILTGYSITRLPDNVTIQGRLDLRNSDLEQLPEQLYVADELILSESLITTLPSNLYALSIRVNQSVFDFVHSLGTDNPFSINMLDLPISDIPVNFYTQGDLSLNGSFLEKLPNNITVLGVLDLSDSCINELPTRWEVGVLQLNKALTDKYLINGATFESNISVHYETAILPDNLTVKGYVDLGCCQVTQLPKEINIECLIPNKKLLPNLLLEGRTLPYHLNISGITQELPNNLTINGDLDLGYAEFSQLPMDLTVAGDLNLSNTRITELPYCLSVGKSIYLSDSGITQLPERLRVKGDLYLDHTQLCNLPERIVVDGDLHLENSHIKALPERLTVEGNLFIYGTSIVDKPLPRSVEVKGSIIQDKQ